jgi:hypothetical protein
MTHLLEISMYYWFLVASKVDLVSYQHQTNMNKLIDGIRTITMYLLAVEQEIVDAVFQLHHQQDAQMVRTVCHDRLHSF